MGVKGACPLGLPPPLGREGVTLAISTPAQKTRRDFYRAQKVGHGNVTLTRDFTRILNTFFC